MPLSVPAAAAARLFRYDLNQIPYNYTVEVRNRFKGLDLIDRVPDELWTLYRRQGSRPFPWKINAKSKMAVWGGLTNSCEKKVKVKSLSRVRLFAAPWTIAYLAPQSLQFSRQGCWSGLSFPSPRDKIH